MGVDISRMTGSLCVSRWRRVFSKVVGVKRIQCHQSPLLAMHTCYFIFWLVATTEVDG